MSWISFAWNGGSAPGGPSQFPMLFILIAMFGIFYFIVIRPQQKKQKALQKMVEGLKKGDRVMTSGGIFGSVSSVKDNIIVLEIAKETKIEVLKSAVASVVNKQEE